MLIPSALRERLCVGCGVDLRRALWLGACFPGGTGGLQASPQLEAGLPGSPAEEAPLHIHGEGTRAKRLWARGRSSGFWAEAVWLDGGIFIRRDG